MQWGRKVNSAFIHLASRFRCGNTDTSGNKMLEFLECYGSLRILRSTTMWQEKSEARNEVLNEFTQVKLIATRDTVVRIINSMHSEFRRELNNVRAS